MGTDLLVASNPYRTSDGEEVGLPIFSGSRVNAGGMDNDYPWDPVVLGTSDPPFSGSVPPHFTIHAYSVFCVISILSSVSIPRTNPHAP